MTRWKKHKKLPLSKCFWLIVPFVSALEKYTGPVSFLNCGVDAINSTISEWNYL